MQLKSLKQRRPTQDIETITLQEIDINHAPVLSVTPDADGEYGAEAYDIVGQLGTGRTGVTKLMRNRQTGVRAIASNLIRKELL